MKKKLMMLAAGALALSASADLINFKATSFNWGATPKCFDVAQIGVARNGVQTWDGDPKTNVFLDIKASRDATVSSKFLLVNDTTRTVAGPAFADVPAAYKGSEYTFYILTWDTSGSGDPAAVVSYSSASAKTYAALDAANHIWKDGVSFQTVSPWEVPESVVVPDHAGYTMTKDGTTATVNFFTDPDYAFADGTTNYSVTVSLTGGAAPVCSNVYYSGTLYFGMSTSGWNLYTDELMTSTYADYTETWTASEKMLTMTDFVHPGRLVTVPEDATIKFKGMGSILVATNDASVAALSAGTVNDVWVDVLGANPAGGTPGEVAWDASANSYVTADGAVAQKLVFEPKALEKVTIEKTTHVASIQMFLTDGEEVPANSDGSFSIPEGAEYTVLFTAQDSYFFGGTKPSVTLAGPVTVPADPIPHTHCVCGYTGCDGKGHARGQVWTCTATLPTAAGYYVLTNDLVVSATWTPSADGIVLCLCGHTIKPETAGLTVIDATGVDFTLTDCADETAGRVEGVILGGKIYAGDIAGSVIDATIYGGTFSSGVTNATVYGGVFTKSVAKGAAGMVWGGCFAKNVLDGDVLIADGFLKDVGSSWTLVGTNRLELVGGHITQGTFTFNPTNREYKTTGLVSLKGAELTKDESYTPTFYTLTAPAILYVSDAGNDYLGDGSVENPFATLTCAYTNLSASGGMIALLDDVSAPVGASPMLTADAAGKAVIVTSSDATGEILENAAGDEAGLNKILRSGCTGPLALVSNGTVVFRNVIFDGQSTPVASPLIAVTGSGVVTNDVNAIWQNAASAGDGGAVSNAATFVMADGVIRDCAAADGGAIATAGGVLTITGGAIGDCTADEHGNGVYMAGGAFVIGGDVSVTNEMNVYLCDNCKLTLSDAEPLSDSALVHITTETAPVMGTAIPFTTNGTVADRKYFVGDEAAYQIAFEDGALALCIPVATIETTTSTNVFSTITKSINHAKSYETIRMVTNRTENVAFAANQTNTLDLAGWVLKGTGSGSVVTVSAGANLTITDTVATAVHYYTVDSKGQLWNWNDANATDAVPYEDLTARPLADVVVAVKGGAITGGNADNGGGVYNSGTLTLWSGNIVGNTSTSNGGGVYDGGTMILNGGLVCGNLMAGNSNAYGGGIYVKNGAHATMNGGAVSYNYSKHDGGGIGNWGSFVLAAGDLIGNYALYGGGGIYTGCDGDYGSTFVMKGGTISGNVALDCGGGISVNFYCDVKLLGGNVISNQSAMAGGVESGWIESYAIHNPYTLGGDIKITDNTLLDGTTPNNLYVYNNYTVAITNDPALASTALIGVTTETTPTALNPVAFTSNGAHANIANFRSDVAPYLVLFEENVLKLGLPAAAIETETSTNLYSSVDRAFAEAKSGETIKLVTNWTENITFPADQTNTLDLAGFVLKAKDSGSVVTVSADANLTLTDTVATAVHNFKVGSDGLWTLTDEAATVDYENLTARPAENAVVAVKGGAITGGNAENGGGIYCQGTVVMNAGTVVGNQATPIGAGGGLYVKTKAAFTLNGGRVIGNISNGSSAGAGGAAYVRGDLVMNGGELAYDAARNQSGSVCLDGGSFVMNDGLIMRNSGNVSGGCVEIGNNAKMTLLGGSITGNIGGNDNIGGGISYWGADSSLTLGGTAVVTNNFASDGVTVCNIYVAKDKTVSITNDPALTTGQESIGVTMESGTGVFAPVATKEIRDCFKSDVEKYYVRFDEGGSLSLANREVSFGDFTELNKTNYVFTSETVGGVDETWFVFKNAQVMTTKAWDYSHLTTDSWAWWFATNVTGAVTNKFEAGDVGTFFDALQLRIAAGNQEACKIAFTNAVSFLVVGNLQKGTTVRASAYPLNAGGACVGEYDLKLHECRYNLVDITTDTVDGKDGRYSLREVVEDYAFAWDNGTNVVLGADGPFYLDSPLFFASNQTVTAEAGRNGLLFERTKDNVVVDNDAVITIDCPFKVQEAYNGVTNYLWLGTNSYIRMGDDFKLQDELWIKTCEDLLTKGIIKVFEPVNEDVFSEDELVALRDKVHAYDPDHNGFTTVIIDGAVWLAARFTVSYDAMDGSWSDGTTVSNLLNYVADGYLVPEQNPTRVNYAFAGWYVSWTNGARRIENGTNLNEYADHRIYAKWYSKSIRPGEGRDVIRGRDLDGGAATAILGASTNGTGEVEEMEDTDFAIPERIGNGVDDGQYVTTIAVEAYRKDKYDDRVSAEKRLTSVQLPSFLTRIGDEAFYACTNVTNVIFSVAKDYNTNSNAVLSIGTRAFAGIAAESVVFPAGSKTKLGAGCFGRCSNLTNICVFGEITGIGKAPFASSGGGGVVTVHLSPAYAADADFVARLTKDMNTSHVNIASEPLGQVTDLSAPDFTTPGKVAFTFKASITSPWGAVNEKSVTLFYTKDLADLNFVGTGKFKYAVEVTQDPDTGVYTAVFERPDTEGATSQFYRLTVGAERK